jgi:DNA-binding winged helix-turn-helix (wHTH) protein
VDFVDLRVQYSFGPFELDAKSRRLTRNGGAVAIPDRHVGLLLELLAHAGEVLSKDTLIEAAWKDVAVSDNSLEQAISSLRRVLGHSSSPTPYIETVARRGYRFVAPVTRAAPRYSREALEALLAPHRSFVEGRAALETLDRDAVERARHVFEAVVRASPDYSAAHVGLAHALVLQSEAMARIGKVPDQVALATALHHAGEACRLDPSSAEAWSAIGLVLHQSRDSARAIAAAQRATALEPNNWRHHLRLAYVSWGEERLRAAHRALQLFPGVAFAHWLAATVYIARQAFAEAEQQLIAGAAAQDQQPAGAKFRTVGLHLLLGLLRLSQGDESSALQEFTRELAFDEKAQLYTPQARANTWCAIGTVRLRETQRDAALSAFDEALDIVPGHPVAMAARAAVTRDANSKRRLDSRLGELREHGAVIEAAFAEATFEALTDHAARAARVVLAALEQQPTDSSGWTVPVEPLLHVSAHPEHWSEVLTLLSSRAA